MFNKSVDFLIFSAERREISHFLHKAYTINKRCFYKEIHNKKLIIIITGVGKNSIKQTIKNQATLLSKIKAKKTFNLGNAGGLKKTKTGTILKIGKCLGQNGKDSTIIDRESFFENITVNSLQQKQKIAEQYPNAYTVDMELFHLTKHYPTIISYKIILDTFNLNPNSIFLRMFLPILTKKNSKLLYNFFVNNYL